MLDMLSPMILNPSFARCLCLVGAVTFCIGCGKAPPEIAPVSGAVRVGGKPQPRLLVRFMPDPNKGNNLPINSSGKTDKEGKYELHYAGQNMEGNGAPVGWHRVMIEDTALGQVPQGQAPPPEVISPVYNSPATTPLSQEVKSGPQTIDFDVTK